MSKKIIVLYHKNCPDGFGAAWAAWKKFGGKAIYVPSDPHELPGIPLKDAELYIVDNSFSKETLTYLESTNKKVVVIDHHISSRNDVLSFPQNVFDLNHSGAVLTWYYFHPGAKTPWLLKYVEDNDLWRFKIPNSKNAAMYINLFPFEFKAWNKLYAELEDSKKRKACIQKGELISRYTTIVSKEIVHKATMVKFEGKKVLAANNSSKKFTSYIGHLLCKKRSPMGIVWYEQKGTYRISLRSVGSFNVAKIAEKFGGGGHKNAAAFTVPYSEGLPWTVLKKQDNEKI